MDGRWIFHGLEGEGDSGSRLAGAAETETERTGAQAAFRRMMVEVVSANEIRDGSPSKPRRASGSIDG
jgi:hypothetical protein